MNINMPRGDLRFIKFAINDVSGHIVDIDLDEIYITFKKNDDISQYLFQKKLSDDSITKDENNYYHFKIEPENTDNLDYGEYVFDIELVKEGSIKQTSTGILKLTKEVTFAENEGV